MSTFQEKPNVDAHERCLDARRIVQESGDLRKALSIVEQIIEDSPDCSFAWFLSGLYNMDLGNRREAKEAARRAIAILPDEASYHVLLGRLEQDDGRLNEAMGHFRRAIELRPERDVLTIAAGIALSEGNVEGAHEYAGRALQLDPEWEEAKAILRTATTLTRCKYAFDIAQERSRLGEALAIVEGVIRDDPRHSYAWFLCGCFHREIGNRSEAKQALMQALAIRSDNALYHAVLGLVERDGGRFDEAMEHLRRANQLDRDQYLITTAKVALEGGDTATAREYAQRALNLDRERVEAEAIVRAADSRERSLKAYEISKEPGRLGEAIDIVGQVIHDVPECSYAWFLCGCFHRALGNLSEAREALEEALSLSPDDAAYHSALGTVEQDAGQLDEAMRHFSRAIELEPTPSMLTVGAGLALKRGDDTTARDYARRALELDSECYEALLILRAVRGGS